MIRGGVRARAARELRQFVITATYLFICFGALILLKNAILRGHGADPVPWGFALVKALVLAKFMLVGQALHLGERYATKPLIWPIVHRTLVFLALLVGLSIVENLLRGLLGGAGVGTSLRGMGGGTPYEAAATVLILLLILLPYFAFRALAEAIGPDRLARLLFVDGRPEGG